MARLRIAEKEDKIRKIRILLEAGKSVREIKKSVACSYELINSVYTNDFLSERAAQIAEDYEKSQNLIPIGLQKKLLGWKAVQQALRGWNHANN